MPTVEKDVLRPGTYKLRDGSQHTFTAQDVRTAVANGNKMLRRGESCPLIWEHDADAVPTPMTALLSTLKNPRDWAAGFVRHCFGYAKEFKIKQENGVPVAYIVNEIPNADDAKRWRSARYCSPRIDRNYCDGSGRVYPGASITHLAATPKPVQTNQLPVMLSATPGKKVPYRGTQTIFLSEETTMPEPTKDDKGKGGKGTESRLKDVLAQLGFSLPDSCIDMDSICIGLEAIAANGGAGGGDTGLGDEDEDDLGGGDDMGGGDAMAGNSPDAGATTQAASPPMMMSQLQMIEKAGKAVVGGYRSQLVNRVERLCKRGMTCGVIDGPMARELARRASGAQLSLTDAGDIQRTEFHAELETLERCVNNAIARNPNSVARRGGKRKPVNLSHIGIQIPQPNGATDDDNTAAVQKAKADAERRMSGMQPDAAKK